MNRKLLMLIAAILLTVLVAAIFYYFMQPVRHEGPGRSSHPTHENIRHGFAAR